MRTLASLVAVAALLLPGCLESDDSSASPGSGAKPATGTMTGALAGTETSVSPCGGGPFCAHRTYKLSGELDLPYLPVAFAVFNDQVEIEGSSGPKWSVRVELTAKGTSAEQAKAHLDDIEFRWSHEEGGGHFLRVSAKPKGSESSGLQASLEAVVPNGVPVAGTAATSNGQASLKDLKVSAFTLTTSNAKANVNDVRADELAVTTSNGAIHAVASARVVTLTTSNAPIDAQLTPTASGSFKATSSNGDIQLKVPEGKTYGYQVSATTSNGDATIGLKDGAGQGGETSRKFTTANYADRSIQTTVTATTSNADVDVRPS